MPYTPTHSIEVLYHEPQNIPECRWVWDQALKFFLLNGAWYINPDLHYDMYGRLFGHFYPGSRSGDDGGGLYPPPLAMDRGLPADVSPGTRSDYEGWAPGSPKWETWVLWSELRHLDLREIGEQSGKQILPEWWTLFDIMASLAGWWGDDRVRLVVYWVH